MKKHFRTFICGCALALLAFTSGVFFSRTDAASAAPAAEKAGNPVKAAFIYVAPENDPAKHRAVIDSPVVQLYVVGVKDYAQAEATAKELVAEGITAIELCAGFGVEGTARVAKAVEGKALVGVVRFDLHPAFNHQSGDKLFQ